MKEEKQERQEDVLRGIKTVVFDLDGTLYDKRGLAARMVRRLWWCLPVLAAERLARRNVHYVQFADAEEFFSYFFTTMARGHWWSADMAATWYNRVYLPTMVKLIAKTCPRRENVAALIRRAKENGLQTAIYSDYGCVTDKLEALGIDPQQFDLTVSAPELGALKPSKLCAERVMELLNADPATTLFVGDRDEKDGASARSVRARFLLVK